MRHLGWRAAALAAVLVLLAGGGWLALARHDAGKPGTRPALVLFTSLPILWGEAPSVSAMLATAQPDHWAREVLDAQFTVTPRDTLMLPAGETRLIMAQPRPLSPQENVALDTWVRGGGRVLLFADPMLTYESAFPLGDRRRPQDVALLSPILARWGLELRFDDAQPGGEREIAGTDFPVNLAGTLATVSGGHRSTCRIEQAGLVATCAIGRGAALIVADAALLEPADPNGRRAAALRRLISSAFHR